MQLIVKLNYTRILCYEGLKLKERHLNKSQPFLAYQPFLP